MTDSDPIDAHARTELFHSPLSGEATEFVIDAHGLKLDELTGQYESLQNESSISWDVRYELKEQIGVGGQGVVYLVDRIGAHDVAFRLALKIFSPVPYESKELYDLEMARLARVAMRLAKIQQDHLLDIHNVVTANGIDIMVMEWVEGYDLSHLMKPVVFDQLESNVDQTTWDYINDVIATRDGKVIRFKPGVAIAILRDCLTGLAALHEQRIVHADLKPSNIMIKLTGHSKIIDFGSAFDLSELPNRWTWTPRYAAPELLQGANYTVSSDLASLGYILLEMLSGESPFLHVESFDELTKAKFALHHRVEDLLPSDLTHNDSLINLIRKLIEPDPEKRFYSAVAADLEETGAAEFHRHLVKADLASEYEHDLKTLLQALDAAQR